MGDPSVMTEHHLTRRVGDRTETALFIRFVDGGGYIEVNGEASVCASTGGPDDWRVGWDWLMQTGFAVAVPASDAEQGAAADGGGTIAFPGS